jgi:hypothetical protein
LAAFGLNPCVAPIDVVGGNLVLFSVPAVMTLMTVMTSLVQKLRNENTHRVPCGAVGVSRYVPPFGVELRKIRNLLSLGV